MSGCGCGGKVQGYNESTLSLAKFDRLLEKGRSRALAMIIANPAARERVEKQFGIDYCKRRYPEAYGINRMPVYDEPDGSGALTTQNFTL